MYPVTIRKGEREEEFSGSTKRCMWKITLLTVDRIFLLPSIRTDTHNPYFRNWFSLLTRWVRRSFTVHAMLAVRPKKTVTLAMSSMNSGLDPLDPGSPEDEEKVEIERVLVNDVKVEWKDGGGKKSEHQSLNSSIQVPRGKISGAKVLERKGPLLFLLFSPSRNLLLITDSIKCAF